MKIIFTILLLFPALLYAQKQADNWYFGEHAGLNFSTGSPTILTDGQTVAAEGVATISDANGGLLFYTDGITVYNRQHQVMQNGTGLYGNISTQSAIIVPLPGSSSLYYIFTVDETAKPKGLCYSTVNMQDDGGLGAVTSKNIPLLTPTCEKITAVRHCNNNDIWVVTRGYANDNYYSWLVTASGITTMPVISSIGRVVGAPGGGWANGADAAGYLKASPDGKKIAAVYWAINHSELSQFDNQTGMVSNTVIINRRPPLVSRVAGSISPYGVEFSSDSKQLYISTLVERVYARTISTIVQYDVSVHDSGAIARSYYFVDSTNFIHYGMQVANNGKLYIADFNSNKVSVINNPNVHGTGCNFQQSVISFPTAIVQAGLPSFIQSYFAPIFVRDFSVAGNCSSLNVQFNTTASVDSLRWNFGDMASGTNNNSTLSNTVHQFSRNGNFDIALLLYSHTQCVSFVDTVRKNIWVGPLQVNLGIDTSICSKDSITLHANIAGANILWSNNSVDTLIKVSSPGDYWVKLTKDGCQTTDTIAISNRSLPQFTLGTDIVNCFNSSSTLATSPAYTNAAYLWSNNAITPGITASAAGDYWLKLTDRYGCVWRDTINLSFKTIPDFSLGNDTAICEKDSITLNATVPGASSYVWSNGLSTPQIKADRQSWYWCDITKDGCTYRDSLQLGIKPLPAVNLGADTTLCEGVTKQLNAFNTNSVYTWQDNTAADNYTVKKEGKYYVSVNKDGCIAKDTINIAYTLKPRFTLGSDQLICLGQPIILKPTVDAGWQLLWQDGSTAPAYTVTKAGIYSLEATNNCGSQNEEVAFTEGNCNIYIPSAFAPNSSNARNNEFRVSGTALVTQFHLQVYNRYGQLVFETTDKSKGWDGYYKGSIALPGAYVYVLQYKDNKKVQSIKGSFLLIK